MRGLWRPARLATVALALGTVLVGTSCASPGTGAATPPATPSASRTVPTATPSTSPPGGHAVMTVVGLGDSVMSGTACGCVPFLSQYAALVGGRDGRTVRPANLGVPGLTARRLAQQLDTVAVRRQLAGAGTVVVTIGANDLVPLVSRWESGGCPSSCVAPAVASMRTAVDAVLRRLALLVPAGTPVLVTDYWNVYEDGDVADAERGDGFADWSDSVTLQADQAICGAAAVAGVACVDLYHPFLGADGAHNPTTLLAGDGDHPNAAGHAVIARTLLDATRQRVPEGAG